MMIEQTKTYVEEHYTIANGYQHDAKVGFNSVSFFIQVETSYLNFTLYVFNCAGDLWGH